MVIPGVNVSHFTKPIVIDYNTYYVVVSRVPFTSTIQGFCTYFRTVSICPKFRRHKLPATLAHLNPEYNFECPMSTDTTALKDLFQLQLVVAENVPFAVSCIGYQR
jgi:hypothetical protein